MRGETVTAHHPSCIAEQAWDIQEAYDHCTCPAFWPHKVCVECWRPPKQHRRGCSEQIFDRAKRTVRKLHEVGLACRAGG